MNEAAQPFEPPPPPPSHPSDQLSYSNAGSANRPANGQKPSSSDRPSTPGTSAPIDRAQRGGRGAGRGGFRQGRGSTFDRLQQSTMLQGSLQGRGEGSRRGRGGRGTSNGYRQQQQFPAMVPQGSVAPQMYFPMASTMYYPPTAYGMLTQMPPGMPAISQDQLLLAVQQQIDYYFSVPNLVKDVFLRAKMNEEGWIPLHVIASFNRVRMLTPDLAMIMEALSSSTTVELSPDNLYIRPKQNHQQWVLPTEQRDATAHATPHMPGSTTASTSAQQPDTNTEQARAAESADAASDASQASAGAERGGSQAQAADAQPSSAEASASASTANARGADTQGSSQQPQSVEQHKDDADEDAAEEDELFEMDEVKCMTCKYWCCIRHVEGTAHATTLASTGRFVSCICWVLFSTNCAWCSTSPVLHPSALLCNS